MTTTTTVRIAVARLEFTPSIPILAKIEVKAANSADSIANKNHVSIHLPFYLSFVISSLILTPIIVFMQTLGKKNTAKTAFADLSQTLTTIRPGNLFPARALGVRHPADISHLDVHAHRKKPQHYTVAQKQQQKTANINACGFYKLPE